MEVKTLKDLAKLVETCRKRGIAEIKITADTLEFKLWDVVPTRTRRTKSRAPTSPTDNIDTPNGPTDEEILFWSSAGIPDSIEGSN